MRTTIVILGIALASAVAAGAGDSEATGPTHPYDAFETPPVCEECHLAITRQHEQAMLPRAAGVPRRRHSSETPRRGHPRQRECFV